MLKPSPFTLSVTPSVTTQSVVSQFLAREGDGLTVVFGKNTREVTLRGRLERIAHDDVKAQNQEIACREDKFLKIFGGVENYYFFCTHNRNKHKLRLLVNK